MTNYDTPIQAARAAFRGRRVRITGGQSPDKVGFVVDLHAGRDGVDVELTDGSRYGLSTLELQGDDDGVQAVGRVDVLGGTFTRTVALLPQTVRVYRASTAEAGGCNACTVRPRPEQVTVVECDPGGGRGGTVTVTRYCDDCAEQLSAGLQVARKK